MAEGKVPPGVTIAHKKHRYPVASWKVTRDRPQGFYNNRPDGPPPDGRVRRVIFRKHKNDTGPARLEIRGDPGELAKMFNEIAAALWGLDGSDRGAEPEEESIFARTAGQNAPPPKFGWRKP